jgi:hypothetical protein
MRHNITAIFTVLAVAVCVAGTSHGASIINFERFGSDNLPPEEGDLVASVRRQGVTISFSTESPAGEVFTPFIAEVADPRVAFQSILDDDLPVNDNGTMYSAGGSYSLTDGLRRTDDYIINFSAPVGNLSLDLYDYRGDGPHASANLGSDNVELQVFNTAGTQIGSDTFVLPTTRPIDGNVVALGVDTLGISSARLHFTGIEGGTAIDNIRFVVPEPSGLGLTVVGLLGLCGLGRRRERRTVG